METFLMVLGYILLFALVIGVIVLLVSIPGWIRENKRNKVRENVQKAISRSTNICEKRHLEEALRQWEKDNFSEDAERTKTLLDACLFINILNIIKSIFDD